jgi:hypothetical protein
MLGWIPVFYGAYRGHRDAALGQSDFKEGYVSTVKKSLAVGVPLYGMVGAGLGYMLAGATSKSLQERILKALGTGIVTAGMGAVEIPISTLIGYTIGHGLSKSQT